MGAGGTGQGHSLDSSPSSAPHSLRRLEQVFVLPGLGFLARKMGTVMPPVGGCREDEATFVEKPGALPGTEQMLRERAVWGAGGAGGSGVPCPSGLSGPPHPVSSQSLPGPLERGPGRGLRAGVPLGAPSARCCSWAELRLAGCPLGGLLPPAGLHQRPSADLVLGRRGGRHWDMSRQLSAMSPVHAVQAFGRRFRGGRVWLLAGPSVPGQQAEWHEVWTHLELVALRSPEPETAPGKDASLRRAGCRPEGPSQLLTIPSI